MLNKVGIFKDFVVEKRVGQAGFEPAIQVSMPKLY